MIVKKIPNPKAVSTKAKRIAGLANYIVEPGRENGLEKCIHSEALNFLTDTHVGNIAEMIALAQDAVRSKDPIDHWVLSWHRDESPSVDQVREAVGVFINHCGLTGHQVIWGLHDDTENMHVHIAVNRVHPETLKVTEINKGFDLNAGHQAIAIIEKRQGWASEVNSRYHVNSKGELVAGPAKETADVGATSPKISLSTKARDMEVRTGEKSAQRIGIEVAAPIIAAATSWKDLHEQLRLVGIRYERTGSGAILHVGNVAMKASAVSKGVTSLPAVQKRLGPYQPPHEIKKNEYHDTSRNFLAANAKKPHAFTFGKDAGHGLRNLSECTLAYGQKGQQAGRARVLQLDARPDRPGAGGLRRNSGRDARYARDSGHSSSSKGAGFGSEGARSAAASRLVRVGPAAGKGRPVALTDNQPGWKEYIALRDAHKTAKSRDTIDQQKRHGAERSELTARLKAERIERLAGNWNGKGEMRNALQSVLATQHGAAKLELLERHRAERKALQARYKPLPVYKQWKDQPMIVGVVVLPDDNGEVARNRQSPALARVLRSLSHTIDSRNHITYQFAGKAVFRDEGRTIKVLDLTSDQGIAAAVVTAQQKFGNVLTLTGSPEFQRDVVAIAVANGLTCRFADPQLDELRAQLQAAKYTSERTAAPIATPLAAKPRTVARLPKKQKDIVVAQTPTPQLSEETASPQAPQQTSAHEWLAAWAVENSKDVVDAMPENGKVEYTVVHVAHDGVVLNKGRTGAVYQVPEGLKPVVGAKVVVDKDSQIRMPNEIDTGKTGRGK